MCYIASCAQPPAFCRLSWLISHLLTPTYLGFPGFFVELELLCKIEVRVRTFTYSAVPSSAEYCRVVPRVGSGGSDQHKNNRDVPWYDTDRYKKTWRMELFCTMFDLLDNGRNGRSPNSVVDELNKTKQAKLKSKDPPSMTPLGSSRGRLIKSFSTSTSPSRPPSSTPSLPPRSHSYFPPNTTNGRTTTTHHRQWLSSTLRTPIDESKKSAEIPIPPSLTRSFSSVDNLDDRGRLVDVYNNATWLMFERITVGRRRQLEGLSAEVQAEVMSEGRRRQRQLTAMVPPGAQAARTISPSGVGNRSSSMASTEEPTFVMELP